jgi:hypothetical protein
MMGTGTLLDGEGHERTNSRLSRSIGLTRRETTGNREQDIALVMEENNRVKRRNFLTSSDKKIKSVFTKLTTLAQPGWPTHDNRGRYCSYTKEMYW